MNRCHLIALLCLLGATALHGPSVRAQAPEHEAFFASTLAARERARAAGAELLAPDTFDRGMRDYERAVRISERGRDPDAFSRQLGRAEAFFVSAAQSAEVAAVTLAIPIASREAALAAQAPERAPALWEDAMEALDDAARQLERDVSNDVSDEADRAHEYFRQAELVAIKEALLTDARETISTVASDRVENEAPLTLAKARSLLDQATALLERDRYAQDEPVRLAALASYEARHASYLANQIRSVRDRTSSQEQLLLSWEEPLERLAARLGVEARFDRGWQALADALEQRIAALAGREDEVARLEAQLAGLQQQMTGLREELDGAMARERAYRRELAELDSAMAALEQVASEPPTPTPPAPCSEATFTRLFSLDEAEVLRENNRLVLRLVGLEFPSGQARLPADDPLLGKLAEALGQCEGHRLTIQGHTDARGDADSNRRLSQARADALRRYAVERLAIDDALVSAIGLGETRPIAGNDTAAGRARNRRTEVVIWPR